MPTTDLRKFLPRLLMAALLVVGFSCGSRLMAQADGEGELEHVRIALKWKHQFQFAGYYAAIEKGFYAEEGLAVELIVPEADSDHLDNVLGGVAEYGVGESGLVLEALKGQPLVLLAQIFQHSPYVLVSKRGSGILEPRDLEGKRVMLSASEANSAPIIAMLKDAGVNFENVTFIPLSFKLDEFVDDEVDVVSIYITDQPYQLKERGIEFNIMNPYSYGIDFYGDNLFCTMREISLHPGRADRVRKATLRGWQYALKHPEEIVELILGKYPTEFSRDHLEFESRMTAMMVVADLVPIGNVNRERYQQIARKYHEFGLSDTEVIPETFFHESIARVPLTAEEAAWLQENPQIRIGTNLNWPPYDITTVEGEYQGINADYLSLVGKRLGVEMIPVIRTTWRDVVAAGAKGEVHCVPGMSRTAERQTHFRFTAPYVYNPVVGITRIGETAVKTWGDLSGKTVLAIASTAIIQQIEHELENVNLVLVDENEEGLARLSAGEGDIFLGWIGSVRYEINRMGLNNLQVAFLLENEESRFRFGINRQYPLLASAMNKAVLSISQMEHIAIRQKWLGSEGNLTRLQAAPPELKSLDRVSFILKSLGVIFLLMVVVLGSAWIYRGCPRYLTIRYTIFGISYIMAFLIVGITASIIFLFKENSELTRVEYAAINSIDHLFNDAQEQYLVRDPGSRGIDKLIASRSDYRESREQTIKSVERFFDNLQSKVREELTDAHNRTDVVILIILILSLITIGFSVYVFYLLKRKIIGPLNLLGNSIRVIEGGDYEHMIELDTPDEVGELARAFNRMTGNIRENYSRLRSVIEATSDGILVSTLNGEITSFNDRFLEAGGFDRDSLEQMRDIPSMYVWLRQNIINAEEVIAQSKNGFNHPEINWHCTAFAKNGKIIELFSFPQWHGEEVIGRVNSIRDVTEPRRAEDQLRKLSQALEQSPTAVCITNNRGVIEFVNTAFQQLTGYAGEELIGLNARNLFAKDLHPEGMFKQVLSKLLAGEVFRNEFRSRRKNGELFWESVLFAPIRRKDGNVTHFVAVRMDISEAKQHQEVLDLQNSRFRNLYSVVSSRDLSQEDILRAIIRVSCETFDMDCAYIGRVEGTIRTVRFVYPEEGGPKPGDSLDLSMACCGLVALKQEPQLIHDLSTTHYKDSYCFQHLHIYAYAGTNIRTSRGNYGVLSMFRRTPRPKPFTDQDRDFLLIVGELIGASVDRLLSNQEIVDRANDLESMNEAMVDRELRMIELKKEVNDLATRLGEPPPYELTWEKDELPDFDLGTDDLASR